MQKWNSWAIAWVLLLMLSAYEGGATEIGNFDTVKPYSVFYDNKTGFLKIPEFIDPNIPCALIAQHFNKASDPNYTYHNPRGENRPNYGWGCVFDLYYHKNYGYPPGTVIEGWYGQGWIYEEERCPAGYNYNTSTKVCNRTSVFSDKVCFKNPILLGDGSKYQKIDLGGILVGMHDFYLVYDSTANIGSANQNKSSWGSTYWRGQSDIALIFSQSVAGQRDVYLNLLDDFVFFEVTDGEVTSQNKLGYRLVREGDEWRLTDIQTQMEYAFDSKGKLISKQIPGTEIKLNVVRNAGKTFSKSSPPQEYGFNPLGMVEQLEHQGKYIRYSYNNTGFVEAVADSQGNLLRFEYNANGMLKKILLAMTENQQTSDSSLYQFEYSEDNGTLLTNMIDAESNIYASWGYDQNGRANLSYHGDGLEMGSVTYQANVNGYDWVVSTKNEFNKTTIYDFTILNGILKLIKVEGVASANCSAANKAYTYYSNGTLQAKTDWKGNTTTYLRDELGREISRTEASGTPQARTIATEYHVTLNKPIRITESDLKTEFIYDSQGRLLNTKKMLMTAQ